MSPGPLTEPLHSPVTSEARLEIIRQMWPDSTAITPVQRRNEINWNAYFNFYNRECSLALVEEGQHLYARSHEDLLQIAQLLRTEPTEEEVKFRIRQRFTQHRPIADEEAMLIGSIRLATRIFAMINTGPLLPNMISGHRSIPWSDETLCDAVHAHFEDDLDSDFENCILGSDLTARNIDRVARISIVWTDNLVDHLRLVERDKKLCVFHHVSFLRHMEHIQRSVSLCCLSGNYTDPMLQSHVSRQIREGDIRYSHPPVSRQRSQDNAVARWRATGKPAFDKGGSRLAFHG
jgi:hypothetical protein